MGALTFVGVRIEVGAADLTVCALGLGVKGVVEWWACQVGFFPGDSVGMGGMMLAFQAEVVTKVVYFV